MKRNSSKRRRPQARRRRTFKLSVPVIWGRAEGRNQKRSRLHAISWRMKLRAVFSALFSSPRWVSLLLLSGIGAAFYFVGLDSTYYISDIQVLGATTLSREAVVQASGIGGTHIFWLNPADIAQRVADIPSVSTVTVEIAWPNSARITIAERAPVIVWDQAGDRFWVDKEGRLMQARQELSDLLLVLSQQSDKLYVGERIPLDVLLGALQLRQERPNIGSLFYEWGNGLSYEDGRHWRAYFGSGLDMNQKLAVYEALVADLQERGLAPKYISVINKDKPFYRLVEPAE